MSFDGSAREAALESARALDPRHREDTPMTPQQKALYHIGTPSPVVTPPHAQPPAHELTPQQKALYHIGTPSPVVTPPHAQAHAATTKGSIENTESSGGGLISKANKGANTFVDTADGALDYLKDALEPKHRMSFIGPQHGALGNVTEALNSVLNSAD